MSLLTKPVALFPRALSLHLSVEAEAALAKSGFSPEVFRHDEEKNTPLDLGTSDFMKPTFSPTSPTEKYEQPIPTYLAHQRQPSRSGPKATVVVEGRQADAQGAPLRVPRLAERPSRISAQSPPKYGVNFGESF